jgi:outer membrane cobalamin receptor
MTGRKKWFRPQAMLWSDTPAIVVDGKYIPAGFEEYSDLASVQSSDRFLILSDHNRSTISADPTRIENSKRMVNGTMRSYHTADKLNISTSWNRLPSRAFDLRANFNQSTGLSSITGQNRQYTVDGGAGATEIIAWYENHVSPFWVFLSYDKYTNFGTDDAAHGHLAEYSQSILMRISDIKYTVVARSGSNATFGGHDLWDVSVSLEEV